MGRKATMNDLSGGQVDSRQPKWVNIGEDDYEDEYNVQYSKPFEVSGKVNFAKVGQDKFNPEETVRVLILEQSDGTLLGINWRYVMFKRLYDQVEPQPGEYVTIKYLGTLKQNPEIQKTINAREITKCFEIEVHDTSEVSQTKLEAE